MHAVILDIDGTLLESALDDDRLYREAVRAVLGNVRLRASLHDYEPVTDTAILRQITDDNGIGFDQELLFRVQNAFVRELEAFIGKHGPFPPIPGAQAFLRRLDGSPLASVAFATGGWRASAALKLQTAGFATDGIPLRSSDDADSRTDIMRLALDSLSGPFDSVTYLGDGEWDERATLALGWRFQPVGSVLGGITHFSELSSDPGWQWLAGQSA